MISLDIFTLPDIFKDPVNVTILFVLLKVKVPDPEVDPASLNWIVVFAPPGADIAVTPVKPLPFPTYEPENEPENIPVPDEAYDAVDANEAVVENDDVVLNIFVVALKVNAVESTRKDLAPVVPSVNAT